MKKALAAIMALIFSLCVAIPAFAAEAGEQRITMGANLSDKQRDEIYKTFGVDEGSVKELKVTNAEEREYLEGVAPEKYLGNVALSCVYITVLEEGKGLEIETNNINWVTKEMYENALITAGITNAHVMVSAPYPLSGTAALTGIYKAYEDIGGEKLDEDDKTAAIKELITTAELADFIGSEEATRLINELKKILDNIKNMSDDEVRAEIRRIADECKVELTDDQVEQLLQLCRTFQNLDVDNLQSRLLGWLDTIDKASSVSDWFAGVWNGVLEFFTNVGDFFKGLFTGGK